MLVDVDLSNVYTLDDDFLLKYDVVNTFLNNPFAKYLVYIKDSLVIGYIYYSLIYDRVEINQVTVYDDYRRQGFASTMMGELISRFNNISLEVSSLNDAAIGLYEKFGFKKVAVREGYYNGIDGFLMIYEK